MKTLIFGGSSDDTFGEITPRGDDYDNCGSGKPIEWLVESASERQSILVVGQHAPGVATGWLVGVAPATLDEEAHIPAWPIRIGRSPAPYSPALEIDVPDDATIRCIQRGAPADD